MLHRNVWSKPVLECEKGAELAWRTEVLGGQWPAPPCTKQQLSYALKDEAEECTAACRTGGSWPKILMLGD